MTYLWRTFQLQIRGGQVRHKLEGVKAAAKICGGKVAPGYATARCPSQIYCK